MSSDPSEKKSPRDLRAELIEAGLAILDEEGLERLTLRRVAARVGVSHAAPAHHFRGLPELLGCICGAGFRGLTAAMEARRDAVPDNPRDRLIAICEAYVDYAQGHPGLMQLMFNAPPGTVDDDALQPAGAESYRVLQECCLPFDPIGDAPDSTESLIWSLVHGLAFLRIGGRFGNPSRATAEPEFCDLLPDLALRQGRAIG